MFKSVGQVSEKEKNEVKDLFEKKVALENLIKIVDVSNDTLYQKLMTDYKDVITLFNDWWDKTLQKQGLQNKIISIDFNTNQLMEEEK